MAYFKRTRFNGIAPGVAPRLLAEDFAQVAENIDFQSGRLTPTTDDLDEFTLQSGAVRSIYFYRDTTWLEWNQEDVKVVPGPIPDDTDDRLYWTGEGYPRMGTVTSMVSGASGYPAVSYRLGVPAPETAPSIAKSGTPDSTQTPDDVSYVYTFVTALGEEGPPSPASAPIERTDTETVSVSMPSSEHPSGNYNFGAAALKRIYRSNTGSSNTTFQFLAEVPFTSVSYEDNTPSAGLGEVLPSESWVGPPDDNASLYPDGPMQGLTALANGVFAGFSGNRFCLSEAFLPHAWPIEYRITLEEDIVAIGAISNGVVALTNGRPYFITGTDPSAMTAVQLDIAQACVNSRSVVDMGGYLLYAGPDGLVAVSGGRGEVVTEGLISSKQWVSDFNPTGFRAFRYENTYVAFWTDGTEHLGFVFDPRGTETAISRLTTDGRVNGGYANPKDGELYLVIADKVKRYRGAGTKRTLTWKSKKYVTPKPVGMSWLSVEAQDWPVEVKVWGDGTLIAHYSLTYAANVYTQAVTVPAGASIGTLREPIMRLPPVVAQEWEVQVSGAVEIDEICLAQSMEEISSS